MSATTESPPRPESVTTMFRLSFSVREGAGGGDAKAGEVAAQSARDAEDRVESGADTQDVIQKTNSAIRPTGRTAIRRSP
jgi:hypothetical protein